jgi:hypothetical protein
LISYRLSRKRAAPKAAERIYHRVLRLKRPTDV